MIVEIIIKNVTGHPENDNCIAELSRAGAPRNSIVSGVYNENNNSVSFTKGQYDCIAYVGQTCEIVNKIK